MQATSPQQPRPRPGNVGPRQPMTANVGLRQPTNRQRKATAANDNTRLYAPTKPGNACTITRTRVSYIFYLWKGTYDLVRAFVIFLLCLLLLFNFHVIYIVYILRIYIFFFTFKVRARLGPGPGLALGQAWPWANPGLTLMFKGQGQEWLARPSIVVTQCYNCHTTATPPWRKDDEGKTVCNAYVYPSFLLFLIN